MNFQKMSKMIMGISVILIMIVTSNQNVSSLIPEIKTDDVVIDDVQILTIIADEFDLNELIGVIDPLESFGCNNTIAGPTVHVTTGEHVQPVDILISEVVVTDYDCIFIPGGLAPDNLIPIPEFITIIQDADALGICLAAICSGPLVFAAADIVDGKNVTGNLSVKAELLAAGGIYFEGAHCITHDHLVTADSPYMFEMVIAITKVLGFYETDPPEIGHTSYELICDGSIHECTLEVEVTDEIGVESVQAFTYKLENGGSTKIQVESPMLLDPEDDDVYCNVIKELSPGDYLIELRVQDLLGNEFTNTSFLELTIEDPNQAGISFGVISVFAILTATILTTRRRKK
ncbi:MAG: DJ-1/PfpI family protein [Candidatus Heimdallarchaeota archaeon]